MDHKFQDALLRISPRFYRLDHPKPTPFSQRGGFECGNGWFDPLFQLGYEAAELLKQHPDVDFYVSQCKEKFGGMRIHLDGPYKHPLYEELLKLCDEAKEAAAKLCEVCGAPGKMQRGEYLQVVCKTHEKRLDVKPHTWVTETIDGGSVGTGDFFICKECSASGGSADFPRGAQPMHTPFLAGLGSSVPISQDCEEARRQIDEIINSPKWKKDRLNLAQHYGRSLIKRSDECYGATVKMAKRGVLFGGWPDREGRAFTLEPKEFRSSLGWELTVAETGEKRDLTDYNSAESFIDNFYSPLVYGELTDKIQARYAEVKGFKASHLARIHLGVEDEEKPSPYGGFQIVKCALVNKHAEGWHVQRLRLGLHGKDKHWDVVTEAALFKVLDEVFRG